jgi:hypothetical protein
MKPDDIAYLVGVQLPLSDKRCHHEADKSHVHRIEHPTESAGQEHTAVEPAERNIVEALVPQVDRGCLNSEALMEGAQLCHKKCRSNI